MLFDFLHKMTYLIFKYLWLVGNLFKVMAIIVGLENQLGWAF